MPEEVRRVAMRVREMREIAGLSVAETAEKIGMETSDYIAHESGETDIPIGFLTQAAQVFGVEAIELMTGESPKLHVYCLVRHAMGIPVQRRPEYYYQSLAHNFQHKKVEPFEVTVWPGKANAAVELNAHPGQEFDYVLSGVLKIWIDGKELVLNPGDSIYFDSSFPHGLAAVGDEPARFIAVVI